MKLQKAGLVGLAAAMAAVGIAAPGIAGGNKYDAVESERVCEDATGNRVGDVVLDGPLMLWPPNHKFVDEPVTVTSDESGEMVSITLMPEFSDAVGGDGGSNHDPDAQLVGGSQDFTAGGTGTATAALQLRAERSGKGEGRTYTVNWTATFGMDSCSSDAENPELLPFTITVPHDMGAGNDDGRNGSKDPETQG